MELPLPVVNLNGITVKQLREWLNSLPDIEPWDTEEPTVWVNQGNVSNQVVELCASCRGDMFLEIRE